MTSILRILSFIFFVVGFIVFLAGLVLAIYSLSDISSMFIYLCLCLFGILLFAIGFVMYEESVYREIYVV